MFAHVIVFLLLCGIVGGETPELLTLTDNCANDFTVRKTNPAISPLRHDISRHVRLAVVEPKVCTPFSHFGPVEKAAALVRSAALTPDTVVRT